jgi:hypothetical protein
MSQSTANNMGFLAIFVRYYAFSHLEPNSLITIPLKTNSNTYSNKVENYFIDLILYH